MMRAGLATVEITPPPNVPLDGFETRKTGSQGVHDPLFARAIVLDDGTTRIAWLIADLVGMPAATTATIRTEGACRAGTTGDRIMVSSTHTHGGPSPHPVPGVEADHAAHARWLEALPAALGVALGDAAAALEPAEILHGRTACTEVQHNRRFHMKDGGIRMVWDNPDPADDARLGPVDPEVQVIEIRRAGRPRGVIAQFACHATAVTGGNFLVTADWPGVAVRELERISGDQGLWVAVAQGCCGDITPTPPRGTFEVCEAKGSIVAHAMMRALVGATPVRSAPLAAARVPVRLPRKIAGPDPSPAGGFYEGEVQVFRIGDLAIVGLPGEPFVEIGLRIKALPGFRGIFVGGYTNDYDDAELGYIPTSGEYGGGYEPTASRVAPGADDLLVSAAREALSRLNERR